MINDQIIMEIKKRLIEKIKPKSIILFGSYALGTANDNSDLDLFIIKKSTQPKYKRGKEIRKILRDIMVPLDIVIYTPEEVKQYQKASTSFINTILREGITLYHE